MRGKNDDDNEKFFQAYLSERLFYLMFVNIGKHCLRFSFAIAENGLCVVFSVIYGAKPVDYRKNDTLAENVAVMH